MDRYPNLRRPISIGGLDVRNRLMMTTHGPRLSQGRYLRYIEERSKDVGLVGFNLGPLGIMQFPFGPGRAFPAHAADLDSVPPHPLTDEGRKYYDSLVPAYRQWGEAAHKQGAKCVGQLYHSGAAHHSDNFQPTVGPSNVADEYERHIPHALTRDEIADLIQAYALGAKRVLAAQYDGVELHGAHGYLIQQFLSPLFNKRDDSYGGSLDNRMRFLEELIDAVRDAVGAGFPVGLRLNGPDRVEGGLAMADIAEIARCAAAKGLAYISIVGGSYSGLRHGANLPYVAPAFVPQGPNVETAAAVRRAVDIPVLVAGRITDLDFAEKIVAEGSADMVGMVRALIADPRIIEKSFAGRHAEIMPCIGGNECHYGRPVACAVNPAAGREAEMEAAPATDPKHILIVGGGPAGLECALAAARRGHRVTLVDRGRELGGMLVPLARASEQADFGKYLDYIRHALDVFHVEIRLEVEAYPDFIRDIGADLTVLATGARYGRANGSSDGKSIIDAAQAIADPSGLGQHVVVDGGLDDHLPPLVTADFIARTGRKVTLLTANISPGHAVEASSMYMFLKRLLDRGVVIKPMTDALSLKSRTLTVRNSLTNAEDRIDGIDSLVRVGGRLPNDSLLAGLDGKPHVIGDALSPRRMLHATLDGSRLGRLI